MRPHTWSLEETYRFYRITSGSESMEVVMKTCEVCGITLTFPSKVDELNPSKSSTYLLNCCDEHLVETVMGE